MLAVIVGAIGALVSLAFTALSIFASVRSGQLFLPTPALGHILAILLPISVLISLSLPIFLTRPIIARQQATALSILSLLDAVLITLASTLLQPNLLLCQLEQRWRSLFQAHNANAIRGIQDTLDCCGLRTPLDQPWPFPDLNGATACRDNFGRQRSCEVRWTSRQVQVLSIWITVAALSLLVKAAFFLLQRNRPAWFQENNSRPHHRHYLQGSVDDTAVEQSSGEERYLDQQSEEAHLQPPGSAR